jgi:hypothetical protein
MGLKGIGFADVDWVALVQRKIQWRYFILAV